MRRAHIDKALNHIFDKHMQFEKGRKTRNPNRSKSCYSLAKPITVNSFQMSFTIHGMIKDTVETGNKLNNYEIAKQVGLEIKQKNIEEE